MEQPVDQQALIERAKNTCQASLWHLCTEYLGYKDWDAVHDDLETFLSRPSVRKAILLPRGHLKTSIVTIGKTIQFILANPNVRVLIANQIWDRARDILREIKTHLAESKLPYIFGNFVSNKWNEDEIVIRQRKRPLKEPTVATTGVEAETTGGHYDVIFLDDLMGLQNSQTPEQREKAKRFRRSMFNLLEPNGQMIEVGTRWHLDDTFSDIFEKEQKYYDIMVRKVVENNKVIFPKKFNLKYDPTNKTWAQATESCQDYIDHLKSSMPLDEFYSQYFNEPIATENQVFRDGMFKYWDKRPDGLYVAMAADLAISQVAGSDETAICVLGADRDWNVYVLDYVKGKWTPHEIVQNFFQKHRQWKPFETGMEVNGFQRTLQFACEEEMRQQRYFFSITPIRTGPSLTKEARIKSLEPFYRQMKVHHAAWMKGKEIETELLTFPKGKHDDLIDAMAMTLPLLSPGTGIASQRMKDGTWEAYAQAARRHSQPFKGFFNGL